MKKADAEAYLKLGNIYVKNGDNEGASKMWEKALELDPKNAIVRKNIEILKYGNKG